jgi:hypothetical protein
MRAVHRFCEVVHGLDGSRWQASRYRMEFEADELAFAQVMLRRRRSCEIA